MTDDHPQRLHLVGDEDPIWRLWAALPTEWRGPIIGPGIDNWQQIVSEHGQHRLDLTGLPDPIPAELAWMLHWQFLDGTQLSVFALNQLATMLRRAIREQHPFPASIRAMDWDTAAALQRWFYTTRWGRLPRRGTPARLRIVFRFARQALIARCHDGPWWALDYWHPRCDPRIPLSTREPLANSGCYPRQLTQPWLRAATKWCLGTMLEAGTLRWTTVSQERLKCLHRFDTWLTGCFDDPVDVLGDPAAAPEQAAAFRRWAADPRNRMRRGVDEQHLGKPVHPRLVNDDLRAVAELFAFVAANRVEARTILGPSPWDRVTEAHAASWLAQVARIPHTRELNDEHYVDDHAMAQILAALPLLGLSRDQQIPITRGDGTQVLADGFDDPQVMRMILLQVLTGRRASEIRTCRFTCLSPLPDRPSGADEGIARFSYAQSKIDVAPDSILVDREVTAVIEEQQQWLRHHCPDTPPEYLFLQRTGNRAGTKPYPPGSYVTMLRDFSDLVMITDSKGRSVRLSHTHRFRHTKLTKLAELGLPVHVLQRYAGHASPTMSMHYVAHREEHAEQAFLATVKLKADGTEIRLSRDDHDSLHLFDRADRILPHGWCLLPPLQTCDKGNACLTCAVFATDETHQPELERQLDETTELITRTTAAFEGRHGRPMPDDNVWLAQRRGEHAALTGLLATMRDGPQRAVHSGGCNTSCGAGCGTCGGTSDRAPGGTVPLALDTPRPRSTQP